MDKTVSYNILKAKYLENIEVKKEFEALELRYRIAMEIARLRRDKKVTQVELAARLKTTTSVISRIESGNQNVSVDMVEKIAEALGKTVEVLFK
jgi:ribosome-binding protein aMBF1 (putative translation factor)